MNYQMLASVFFHPAVRFTLQWSQVLEVRSSHFSAGCSTSLFPLAATAGRNTVTTTKAVQLTQRVTGEVAPTLAVNLPGRQMYQAQAILSHAAASVVAMMGLPRSSSLQLEAGHCHGLTGTSTSRETGSGPCKEEEEEKKGLFGGDGATCIPEPWGPGRHSKAWPRPSHPSVVPRMYVMAAAASPQGCPPRQTHHGGQSIPEGGSSHPRAQPGVAPPSRGGRCTGRPAGWRRGIRPGQNTQAQRARLCWSILFQSCGLSGGGFFISSLNITKRDSTAQSPAILGPSAGQHRRPRPCRPACWRRQWQQAPRGAALGRPCRPARILSVGRCGQHTRETERGSYGPAD